MIIDVPNGEYEEVDGKLIFINYVFMDEKLPLSDTKIDMFWRNPNVMNLDLVVVGIHRDTGEMCILIGTGCTLLDENGSCNICEDGKHGG